MCNNCGTGVCGAGGKCGCGVKKIVKILLIIGGLNWGLVGVGTFIGSNLNVVNLILGSMPTIEAIVYILVGLAAFVKIFGCPCAKCQACKAGCAQGNIAKPM